MEPSQPACRELPEEPGSECSEGALTAPQGGVGVYGPLVASLPSVAGGAACTCPSTGDEHQAV